MARGIFAALEDLEADSTVYGDTPYGESIEEADVDARDEMEDAEHESDRIDTLMESAGEGLEDTETLQEIGGAIGEAAATDVGIDDVAIKPAIIATEGLCKNLGLEHFQIMPALESFASTNSRVAATRRAQVSIEGVVSSALERIGKVMEVIAEKVRKFINKVMEMYRSALLKYQMRVKKEIEKAPAGKGEGIKSKSLVRAFGTPSSMEVTAAKANSILDGHMEMGKFLTSAKEGFPAFVREVIKEAATKSSEELETFIKSHQERSYKGMFNGKDLINGTHIEVTKDNKWERPEFKSDWTAGKDPAEDAKVECLDKGEMKTIIDKAETIMKDAIKNRKAVDDMLAEGHKALTELKSAEMDEAKTKAAGIAINKVYRDNLMMSKEIFNLERLAVKAAVDYCKESLASIKKVTPPR